MKILIQSAEAIQTNAPPTNPVAVNRMPAAIVGIVLVALLGIVAFFIHDAQLSGAIVSPHAKVIIHQSGLIPTETIYANQTSITLENTLESTVLVNLGTLCTTDCEYTLIAGSSMDIPLPTITNKETFYVTHKKELAGTIVPAT